ncbi:indole-3-glycerol phosphate synthase TrpC [bacterium]|jgi:indole-3-glycerol phosphate synthase|nr:indole-3-glycerol phosphate synthase TrpC [bacterium]
MTFLDSIVQEMTPDIELLKESNDLASWQLALQTLPCPASLLDSLAKPGLSLISEVKKASPSKGVIRKEFDPVSIAQTFEMNGASALSVLTEPRYFQGSPDHLRSIRKSVLLPILRKDFILDAIQIPESRAMGASAILLIVAILSDTQIQQFILLANKLSLDVLVEVHDESEVARVIQLNVNGRFAIGINNRNLKTFDIDLVTAPVLKEVLRSKGYEGLIVAESGYSSIDELEILEKEGFDGVLVGEGLARHPDILTYFDSTGH